VRPNGSLDSVDVLKKGW